MPTHLRIRRRSFLGLLFLFSLSTSALYFIYSAPGIVNEYVFMVQARGIQIRENVKNIGAQVLEQVVRGAYSINGTDSRLLDSGTLETDFFAHAASLIFGFPVDHSSKSGFFAANAVAGIQRRSRLLMLCTGTLLMLLAVLL